MKLNNKLAAVGLAIALALPLSGCATDADVTSYNLSQSAEKFEINRRIVFFNGITDKYLLEVQGFCVVDSGDNSALAGALEVVCKTGNGEYKKHFLGLSDNVSYFVEQVESANVSAYHYKVIFKPEAIIPDIELRTSGSN